MKEGGETAVNKYCLRAEIGPQSFPAISIRDLTGRQMVYEKLRPEDWNGLAYPIDISGLRPGVYFLSVDTDQGVYSRRFVKE